MAIYFGNLDRELADRQNVLKEDAARQYRGSKDMMESFSDLGETVERGMKDYSTAKLEAAKLNYNIERNKESDQIRKLSFQQSTKRNKELTLDSQLRNVEKFRATSVANHIGKQWYWRDPKTVRAAYDDRMKQFTADQTNIDPEQRIKAYPHLYGKNGLANLKVYEDLLILKEKDGNSAQITDEQLKVARDKLPIVPMDFMAWAKNSGLYNSKITGNPGRAAGAMQTTILRNAGYNIPNVDDLTNAAQKENPILKVGAETEVKEKKGTDASKIAGYMGRDNEEGTPIVATGEKAKTKKDNPLLKSGEKPYKIIHGQVWDIVHGVFRDSIEDVYKFQPVTSQTSDDISANVGSWPGPSAGSTYKAPAPKLKKILADEAIAALKNVNDNRITYNNMDEADALRAYDGRQRYDQPDEVQVAVTDGNSFKATKEVAKQFNTENTPVRSSSDMAYNLEGSERERNPAFFPFMEGYKGKALGSDYSKLPNYSTWENVSPEERKAIETHPETEMYGASPKSVAGLIKARGNLEDIDSQIDFIKGDASKYNKPLKEGDHVKNYIKSIESIPWFNNAMTGDQKQKQIDDWKKTLNGLKKARGNTGMSFVNWNQDYEKELEGKIAMAEKYAWDKPAKIPAKGYDGLIGKDPQAEAAKKRLAMQLPLLEDQRKELVGRFNTAQATVDASKLDKSKSIYRGSVSDFGVSNDQGPAIIRPEAEPIPNLNEMGRPKASTDPGVQAAIDANYAEDTQKEIIGGIIDREGWGPANGGYSYFDGGDPDKRGYYKEGGGESLTLAGGNNIYDTINSMSAKERKIEMEEVATAMFGNGGVRRKEFIRFMNMPKKDHKKEYDSIVKRGRLRLTEGQRDYLTGYSYKNHLNRLVKNYPYLSDIAQYPKEMQVFSMDNAFNMGPKWLSKFKKTEVHLKNWVTKGRKSSDLEKMKAEYKNSDHYRNTTRAQDLVAMLTIN